MEMAAENRPDAWGEARRARTMLPPLDWPYTVTLQIFPETLHTFVSVIQTWRSSLLASLASWSRLVLDDVVQSDVELSALLGQIIYQIITVIISSIILWVEFAESACCFFVNQASNG